MRPWLLVLTILTVALVLPACTADDEEDDETADESVTYNLRVDTDDVFGFVQDAQIGTVTFSDSDGIVGQRIKCEVHLDDIDRFQEATLAGTLELINANAIKDDSYLVEFEVADADESFDFYIPQIVVIPALLNFEFVLRYEEENAQGVTDVFEASLVYEFNVNKGRPAT